MAQRFQGGQILWMEKEARGERGGQRSSPEISRMSEATFTALAACFMADAPQPWIDLSTGINPHAYPFGTLPAACYERLPAASAFVALENAAAAAYGASGIVAAGAAL